MAMPQINDEQQVEDVKETSAKGTIVSVAVVGAVIFGTYLLLFGLYMSRV